MNVKFKLDENENPIEAGRVNIKIDDAYESLIIKEIDKEATNLVIDELNDTAIFNDIILRASLYDTEDNLIKQGTVTITIYKDDRRTQVYSTETVIDNNINISIPNSFKTGIYYVVISYGGNKYYQASEASKFIRINKRHINCIFKEHTYYVDAGTTTTIEATLKDVETLKPVSNCVINYKFNNEINQLRSNENGTVMFVLDVPEQNKEHCIANTQSYTLIATTENESYILKNTKINIIVKKEDTDISIQGRNMNVTGDVITDDGYAKYGTVEIKMLDGTYKKTVEIEENGHFNHDINIIDLAQNLQSDITQGEPNNISSKENTYVEIESTNYNVTVGDSFIVNAHVTNDDNRNVLYGVVDFRLINSKNHQTYRYVTELDDGGMGNFVFYTSKPDTYRVKAYYKAIVGYKESESEYITIKVKEDNNGL